MANNEETPLGRLVDWEAVAYTERDGRKYVAVRGKDERDHRGHIVLNYDNGELIYEHGIWSVGAYCMEGKIHHEFERLMSDTKELYFGVNGVDKVLCRALEDKLVSQNLSSV